MELHLARPARTVRARIRFLPYIELDDPEGPLDTLSEGDDRELLAHNGVEIARASLLERLALWALGLQVPDRRRRRDAELLEAAARRQVATASA